MSTEWYDTLQDAQGLNFWDTITVNGGIVPSLDGNFIVMDLVGPGIFDDIIVSVFESGYLTDFIDAGTQIHGMRMTIRATEESGSADMDLQIRTTLPSPNDAVDETSSSSPIVATFTGNFDTPISAANGFSPAPEATNFINFTYQNFNQLENAAIQIEQLDLLIDSAEQGGGGHVTMVELYNSDAPSELPEPTRREIFDGPGEVCIYATGTAGGETVAIEVASNTGEFTPALQSDGTQLEITGEGSWIIHMPSPLSRIRAVPDDGGSPDGFVVEVAGGR